MKTKRLNPLILLLTIFTFINLLVGCNLATNDQPSAPTGFTLNGTTLTWNESTDATIYKLYIKYNQESTSIQLTERFYDFNDLLPEASCIFYFNLTAVIDGIESKKTTTLTYNHSSSSELATPSNFKKEGTVLSWNRVIDATSYILYVTFDGETKQISVTDTSYDFSVLLKEVEGTFYFSVSAVNNLTESAPSNQLNYIYTIQTDYPVLILSKSLMGQTTAPSGWVYSGTGGLYADTSLKFAAAGAYVITESFEAHRGFSVAATILGNGTGGDATITMYGLSSAGTVIETVAITGKIATSKHIITAEFTNTNIVKIKLEYTVKATGNFGLYQIDINHDEVDTKIVAINAQDLKTNYFVNQPFDKTHGKLLVTYKDQQTDLLSFEEINYDIEGFDTTCFGTRNATITYQGFTCNFTYTVSYPYHALYTNPTDVTISPVGSSDAVFIQIGDLSVLVLGQLIDYNQLESYLNLHLNNNHLDYLITSLETNPLSTDFTVGTLVNPTEKTAVYHLAPSITIKLIGDKNNILVNITIYDYQIAIAASTSLFLETNYQWFEKNDILIVGNAVLQNMPMTVLSYLSPQMVIINEDNFVGIEQSIKNIYNLNSSCPIYDSTNNDALTIDLTTVKYLANAANLTEFSSTLTWQQNPNNENIFYEYIQYLLFRDQYYTNLDNLTGGSLKLRLSEIITSTHTNQVTYDLARTTALLTDPDFNNPGNIILIYTGNSVSNVWDNGITWNREHIWPKALSGGLYRTVSNSDSGAGADLHQLKPASPSVNSSRSDKTFGNITNATYYAPRDEVKGDIARIIFYMALRYNMDIEGLKVAESIALLISWHNADPVDYAERYRNEAIGTIQGNYNPFIDNPFLADLIFN